MIRKTGRAETLDHVEVLQYIRESRLKAEVTLVRVLWSAEYEYNLQQSSLLPLHSPVCFTSCL
jgi:hypothetical protein